MYGLPIFYCFFNEVPVTIKVALGTGLCVEMLNFQR
jgi:hypothetical protein